MNRSGLYSRLVIFCAALMFLPTISHSTPADAWQALHKLDLPRAKDLFKAELAKSPKDVSLMRGLMLAAHFDFDHETEVQAVRNMVAVDPSNPYLLPVFEHVAATMTDWGEDMELRRLIGDALAKNAHGAVAHVGRQMVLGVEKRHADRSDASLYRALGFIAGAWVSGPFENSSNIAAYRKVTWEGEPLDTTAVTTGRNGALAGWVWNTYDPLRGLAPVRAMSDASVAFQFRIFFDLPRNMDVLLSTGGMYSGRFNIDGLKLYDNGLFRNAEQRDVFRVPLRKGIHEITAVLATDSNDIALDFGILDTLYKEIPGLTYPRFGTVAPDPSLTATTTNPIFDSFEAYVKAKGEEPDTRYFRAILHMYNAQVDEAIRDLEQIRDSSSISQLENWALYTALDINGEHLRANEALNSIHETAASARVDFAWTGKFMDNPEGRVNAFVDMANKYPGRMEILLISGLKPLFSGDIKGALANLNEISSKFPKAISSHTLASTLYQSVAKDLESAIQEFIKSSQISDQVGSLYGVLPSMYISAGNWDKAISAAKTAMAAYPAASGPISSLVSACVASGRTSEGIPILEQLARQQPYNVNVRSYLYDLYSKNSQFDRAKTMLQEIHRLKPAAVLPYLNLDSLRNNCSLDSIFGTIDPMTLWDVAPLPKELGEKSYWLLLDRRQNLIFESGVVAKDIQIARVLVDQEAVKDNQEWNLQSTLNSAGAKLLGSRRLRKGQAPLSAQVKDGQIVFQDLRPGDAIEIHYRIWEANQGDLWHEFWTDYNMHASVYQRFSEFAVMTNRSDLKYVSQPPCPDPVITKHCGFQKYDWTLEKIAAWRFDLSLLPPTDDITGRVTFSTIADWNKINRWYSSISDAVLGDNPRAKELAHQLVTPNMTEREKLWALYKHVVLNIPYQTIDFNYDAAIPHSPDQVLINRWGDCKDKAHLLIQMLREVGMTAWPVLVKTRSEGTRMLLPEFAFNHLILGCLIGKDTLFVDPSGATYPPDKCMGQEVATQPRLDVGPATESELKRLPAVQTDDNKWSARMVITPQPDAPCKLTYMRQYLNQEAGGKRYDLAGTSLTTLREKIASEYSDEWAVALTIDSLVHDTIESIDSVFNETWWGTVALNIQTIGKTTVINRPDWSIIPKSLLAELAVDGKRDFPVDLRQYYGVFEKTLEIYAPESYGTPKPLPAVTIKDSLWNYSYNYTWDKKTRKLTLQYILKVDDGYCDWQKFADLSKKVIETFDSPLLFEKN